MRVSKELRERVRVRAQHACEYCRLPQHASVLPHQVDHVVAVQHFGSDEDMNLCLCCIRCNLKKGPNIASRDPADECLVPLFHPRTQVWHEHFSITESGLMQGLTPVGRATLRLLEMNDPERQQIREMLLRRGWQP